MKIKVTTRLFQYPKVEIDGKDVNEMLHQEQIEYLKEITEKLTGFKDWFGNFLFSVCTQFGEEIPDEDFSTDVFELNL